MVNPGAFRGLRKDFLMAEKENYAAGMEGGYGADALAQIQRRFFKRFPVELGSFEEPSSEHLASVQDEEPEPEPEEPDPEKLTPEEYDAAKKRADHRKEVIRFRKAQIKRWLAYQYMKDQDLDPKESGVNNPFHSLIFAITGKEAGRPRRRIPVNVWRKTQRETIEAKVKELATREGITKDRLAVFRDKLAREMFNDLPPSEQDHWKQQANIESELALEQWKRAMLDQPPSAAKDYQLAIQGLVRITQPFLDFLCKATGWKATLITGGPEPAQGGRLNVISIHSGCTPGDIKLNWGRALRARFKKDVVSCFGDFLKMCYTPEDCRARALSPNEGFQGLLEDGCNEDSVDLDSVESAFVPNSSASFNEVSMTSSPQTTSATKPSASQTHVALPRHSHTPFLSSSNPLSSSNKANVPALANISQASNSKRPVPYTLGRKGPTYERVPPVRTNTASISLGKKVAAPSAMGRSRPLPTIPARLLNREPMRSTDLSPIPLLPSSDTIAARPPRRSPVDGLSSRGPGPVPSHGSPPSPPSVPTSYSSHGDIPISPRGATPFPSRGATPFPSRGATPFPSRGATPFPSRGATPFPSRAPTPLPSCEPNHEPSHVATSVPLLDSILTSHGQVHRVPARLSLPRQNALPEEPRPPFFNAFQTRRGIAHSKTGRKRRRDEDSSEYLVTHDESLQLEEGSRRQDIVELTAPCAPKVKEGRKNKGKRGQGAEPSRKSKRLVTEKHTDQELPLPGPTKAKKRRKSTGTWIVSDDEGGWRDQDGNPCDAPVGYHFH